MLIKNAIISLRAGASWELNGNTYADLLWLDEKQTKPTETEVDNMIAHLNEIGKSKHIKINI